MRHYLFQQVVGHQDLHLISVNLILYTIRFNHSSPVLCLTFDLQLLCVNQVSLLFLVILLTLLSGSLNPKVRFFQLMRHQLSLDFNPLLYFILGIQCHFLIQCCCYKGLRALCFEFQDF